MYKLGSVMNHKSIVLLTKTLNMGLTTTGKNILTRTG